MSFQGDLTRLRYLGFRGQDDGDEDVDDDDDNEDLIRLMEHNSDLENETGSDSTSSSQGDIAIDRWWKKKSTKENNIALPLCIFITI